MPSRQRSTSRETSCGPGPRGRLLLASAGRHRNGMGNRNGMAMTEKALDARVWAAGVQF